MRIDFNAPASTLVGHYNELIVLAGGGKPIAKWKGRKDVLVDKIKALQKMKASTTPGPDNRVVAFRTRGDKTAVAKPVARPNGAKEKTAQPKAKKPDGPTIREVSIELLCHVEYHEDRSKDASADNRVDPAHKDARSVGLPYDAIISRIKQRFPDCQTSVACLRWYSVKMRAEEHGYEGLRLPQRRPRVKPVGKK